MIKNNLSKISWLNKYSKYLIFLGAGLIFEILSFLGHLCPTVNIFGFILLTVLVLILTLIKLEYGALVLLAELFIGSKGYLFSAGPLSLRMAFWAIVLAVWLAHLIIALWKNWRQTLSEYWNFKYAKYYLVLFVLIVLGVLNAWWRNHEINNIFLDFNAWLYFLIIFPLFKIFKSEASFKHLGQVFFSAVAWIGVKTYILLYIFSHDFGATTIEFYRWVRDTGVGEITLVSGNFYRIFFQSHIYLIIGLFLGLFLFNKYLKNNRRVAFVWLGFNAFLLSNIIISFSRSFWVGLVFGLALFYLIIWRLYDFKRVLMNVVYFIVMAIISFTLVLFVVKFPYPASQGSFNFDLLSDRADLMSSEAAISSRWSLFAPLWQEIKKAPFLGQGFGTTITYKTSDPRILEKNPSGLYTTYAFEWGWLDIWLKLGFFGLLAYLAILLKLIIDAAKIKKPSKPWLINGLIVVLVALFAINMFTPYFNHPLGIGALIISSLLLSYFKE